MKIAMMLSLILAGSLSLVVSAEELQRQTWSIDGVEREALVHLPKTTANAPALFFFHGRGGKIAQVAKQHAFHTYWPEAIVVFPQGRPTQALKGSGGNQVPGWQVAPGHLDDRDLKFFDAMLETFKTEYKADAKRIFAAGTSNGGGMTFLVWSERGSQLTAVAPTCTAARAMSATGSEDVFTKLPQIPSLHVVGENDATIPASDQFKTIELIRNSRKCEAGVPWGQPPVKGATLYASPSAPVVTLVYPGGHGLPPSISPTIVDFFRNVPRAK